MINFKIKILQKRFERAIEYEDIETIKKLIYNENINPFYNEYYALIKLSSLNNIKAIRLFLKLQNIDLPIRSFCVFRTAAEYNSIDVIKILIEENNVSPTVINNYAIKIAYKKNNKEVYTYLFKIKEVRQMLLINDKEFYDNLLKNEILNKINNF